MGQTDNQVVVRRVNQEPNHYAVGRLAGLSEELERLGEYLTSSE